MIDEYSITLSEMDRIANQIGVSATERAVHPLMLMTADIDAHVAMQNRIIEVGNGDGLAYCDAPPSVVVSFGVVGRKVFLLREPCVRHALLDHYAEHSRALDSEVDLFIRQQRENIGIRLGELKQTAAPDQVSAIRAFTAGLWSILRDVLTKFKQNMADARPEVSQKIDSNEQMGKLQIACDGNLRELEQKIRRHDQNVRL